MIVDKEDQEKLIKRQMKAIDDLQEKIKLQQFEISKMSNDLKYITKKLRNRNNVINNAKRELYEIKRTGDIRKIDTVLKILKEDSVIKEDI